MYIILNCFNPYLETTSEILKQPLFFKGYSFDYDDTDLRPEEEILKKIDN